jgi:hypothetical protein
MTKYAIYFYAQGCGSITLHPTRLAAIDYAVEELVDACEVARDDYEDAEGDEDALDALLESSDAEWFIDTVEVEA